MDYKEKSVEFHKKYRGKLEVCSKVPAVKDKEVLSLAYTPGVAGPCLEIKEDESKWRELTSASNTIAVVSDGTAVLGLSNIGAKASLPVMEGKAVLFKEYANVNAFPIVLETEDVDEIVKTVKLFSSSFGGINLEDISAPRCFEVERRLKEELNVPIFHDDQHGTAIVVLAGLINSLKLVNKSLDSKVVINGSGAAGVAISKLLDYYGFKNQIICDSKGIISKNREDLNEVKKELASMTNPEEIEGDVYEAIKDSDIFIGVSKGDLLGEKEIRTMNENSIIMAMSNPIPEVMPDVAKKGGAKVVATGRSDFENQLNNVLVFPGIFKGALESGINDIDYEVKVAAAQGLANLVENPTPEKIIPTPFDEGVADAVANSVKNKYL